MTTRLLAFLVVLGLLPVGQLVASIAGAAQVDSCATGNNGDICPEHCCPNCVDACRCCHNNPTVARIEPSLDVPRTLACAPPTRWIDHDGRGLEPPPVPPPLV